MKVIDFVEAVAHVMRQVDNSPANTEIKNTPVMDAPMGESELMVRQQLADVFDTGYREGANMVLGLVDRFKLEVEISDEIYEEIKSSVNEGK